MTEKNDPVLQEALERFQAMLRAAAGAGLKEPSAMTLATVDAAGQPDARIVLLRGVDDRGFVFFTNSGSTKGQQLSACPRATLCFYWDPLEQQARIQGPVEVVSVEESDAYWSKRHRGSQIGAWASDQSQVLDARATLEARVAAFEAKFAGQDVPRPPHWFGYRVVPKRIELWYGKPSRLHERWVYEMAPQGWRQKWLFP